MPGERVKALTRFCAPTTSKGNTMVENEIHDHFNLQGTKGMPVPTIQSAEELGRLLNALVDAAHAGCTLTIDGAGYIPAEHILKLAQNSRRLRYRLKQANQNIGRQGQTIHLLRAEIAEVRHLSSRLERGELRAADRKARSLETLLASAREEITRLNEKLAEQDLIELVNDTDTTRNLYAQAQTQTTGNKVKSGDNIYAQNQAQADAVNKFIETGE